MNEKYPYENYKELSNDEKEKNVLSHIYNSTNKNNIINNKKLKYNINIPALSKNFNMTCQICKNNASSDIIYFCSDCRIYFCEECEANKGKIHKHCYYKIRNKKQYDKLKTLFNDSKNNSNKNFIENSVNEIFTKGSKLIGNIGNTFKNFFNKIEDDTDIIKSNNVNSNEFNNPYIINNNIEQEEDKNEKVPDEKELKTLIMKAKTLYNLSKFNNIDIERALVQKKGNIEKAVVMLLKNEF